MGRKAPRKIWKVLLQAANHGNAPQTGRHCEVGHIPVLLKHSAGHHETTSGLGQVGSWLQVVFLLVS